ncbi:MBL fold metallo-hydrolase [Chengkuizengella marina]|nr:MBL fold metallo-hydrolase [Chengkuizengella marina]
MKSLKLMKSIPLFLFVIISSTLFTACIHSSNSNLDHTTLEYLGHSSIKIVTNEGKVIYIDPWSGENYDEPADIVLITHFHYDHSDIEKVEAKKDTVYITPSFDFEDKSTSSTFPSTKIAGIKIYAVPAYNEFHKKEESFGYILELGDVMLYHAGDTSNIEEMKLLSNLNITYALLPIDGIYNMDPIEATVVAKIINAEKVIPISTGEDGFYNEENIRMFNIENKEVLKPGDVIELIKE